MDALINNILVPVGSKGDFNVKNVFQQTGNLRGIDVMNFLKCILCYICFHAKDLPDDYKLFFRLLSGEIGDLLSPVFFDDAEIDELEKRIIQLVCLREGLFPASEALFCIHQLIHIPSFIKKWGPVMSFWALSGERNVGEVKKEVPIGGKSILDTTMERCLIIEEAKSSK